MELIKFTGPFIKLFYYSGLSPYNIEGGNIKPRLSPPTLFYVVVQTCIGNALAFSCFYFINIRDYKRGGYWSRTEIIIMNFFFVCETVRTTLVSSQSIFHKSTIHEIIDILRKLETYFAIQLHHKISYRIFTRKFTIKCVVLLCCYIQLLVVIMWHAFAVRLSPIQFQVKTLQFIKLITFLHIMFYIDILAFFLSELSIVIQNDWQLEMPSIKGQQQISKKKSPNASALREKLKFYKKVHYHLWEISQKINLFFGWCLVAVLMHAFVETVYGAYWFIQEIEPPVQFQRFISKLIFIFNSLLWLIRYDKISIISRTIV